MKSGRYLAKRRKELRYKMQCANDLICLVNIQIINRISPMFIKKYTKLVFSRIILIITQ